MDTGAASEVADRFGLDEVVFVPTRQPWQKWAAGQPGRGPLLMTVVATASNRVLGQRGTRSNGPTTADPDGPAHRKPDAQLYFSPVPTLAHRVLSWRRVDELFALAFRGGDPAGRAGRRPLPDGAVSSSRCRDGHSSTDCRGGWPMPAVWSWCPTASSSTSPSAPLPPAAGCRRSRPALSWSRPRDRAEQRQDVVETHRRDGSDHRAGLFGRRCAAAGPAPLLIGATRWPRPEDYRNRPPKVQDHRAGAGCCRRCSPCPAADLRC